MRYRVIVKVAVEIEAGTDQQARLHAFSNLCAADCVSEIQILDLLVHEKDVAASEAQQIALGIEVPK